MIEKVISPFANFRYFFTNHWPFLLQYVSIKGFNCWGNWSMGSSNLIENMEGSSSLIETKEQIKRHLQTPLSRNQKDKSKLTKAITANSNHLSNVALENQNAPLVGGRSLIEYPPLEISWLRNLRWETKGSNNPEAIFSGTAPEKTNSSHLQKHRHKTTH